MNFLFDKKTILMNQIFNKLDFDQSYQDQDKKYFKNYLNDSNIRSELNIPYKDKIDLIIIMK